MHTYVNPGSRTQTVGLGFMAAGALLALFAVGYDQGLLTSPVLGGLSYQLNLVHETFHDARHIMGLACH